MIERIEKAYNIAKEVYAEIGVDTEKVLKRLRTTRVSFNAWQMDDVRGFINRGGAMSGGILSTGNYAGASTNPEQLRQDVDKAFSLIPGKHKLSLQATQVDTDEKIDLDQIETKHYKSYVDWAKEKGIGLDFNPSCYSHQKASTGFTLASMDKGIRDFWIEHCKRSSRIGAYFGKKLGIQAVTNFWICDGYKDYTVDMFAPRHRLEDSLNQIFANPVDQILNLDTLESKLFGIGLEAYTVGSHEFYMMYAAKNNRSLCLDAGHFHPTEEVANKISSVMLFSDEMELHISRPMRWDSDHVVSLNDSTQAMINEVVRNGWLERVHIGTDYFDASINRITACVIGMRNIIKALLIAMLEPTEALRKLEMDRNYSERLAMLEELKSYPFTAVWDYYCIQQEVPVGNAWFKEVQGYERSVLAKR